MRWRFALCLLLLSCACTPLKYAATTPPRASGAIGAGHASARVVSAEVLAVTGTVRYRLLVQAPAGARLGMARLTGAYQARCAGGDDAILMRIDGEDRWQGDPVPIEGRHELELDFPGAPGAASPGPRALDLELGEGARSGCLRVLLRQSAAPEAGWKQTNSGDQAFAVDGAIPLFAVAGLSAMIAFRYELGFWAGPLRLAVQPGPIGLAICSEAVCGKGDRGEAELGPFVPLGLSVSSYPWQSGLVAFGAEARLRESLVWLPAETGTERFWVHAPEGVIHLALAPAMARDGLPGGPRVLSTDLELSAGALIVRREGETLSAPMLGIGFALHTWL